MMHNAGGGSRPGNAAKGQSVLATMGRGLRAWQVWKP